MIQLCRTTFRSAPTVTVSAATVGVDETLPGADHRAGYERRLGLHAGSRSNRCRDHGRGAVPVLSPQRAPDPDVPAGSLDDGALSFCLERDGSIVTVTGGFGADGPVGTVTHDLTLSCDECGVGADPDRRHGDHAVDGSIGQIIGTVGPMRPIRAEPARLASRRARIRATGQIYVAQYLSLHQVAARPMHAERLRPLAAGTVGVTVTLTDGDARPGQLDRRYRQPSSSSRRRPD